MAGVGGGRPPATATWTLGEILAGAGGDGERLWLPLQGGGGEELEVGGGREGWPALRAAGLLRRRPGRRDPGRRWVQWGGTLAGRRRTAAVKNWRWAAGRAPRGACSLIQKRTKRLSMDLEKRGRLEG